ncbi:MAG: tetratricopeptide repeat protein [Gammaproteobacteria bacterium]
MKILVWAVIAILAGKAISSSSAEPYTPSSDDQVLERLPSGTRQAWQLRIRALRATLVEDPRNLEVALAVARDFIRSGKTRADPRFYGYAEGILSPWWNLEDAPSEVLLLRASILQSRHDFEGALTDLDRLIARDPGNTRAWFARSAILLVRADYAQAQRSCLPLVELDNPLRAATCLGRIGALTGHAQESFTLVRETLENSVGVSDEERFFSLSTLAEFAARLGHTDEAGQLFHQALTIRSADAYLLGLYADFLLDQNRPEEVVALLSEHTRIDSLLLRLALAKKQLASDDLPNLIEELSERFAAERLRGDNLHPGDEARFRLFLLDQPEAALRLAKANWQRQREPKDIRILLETAQAAGKPEDARPAIDLVAETHLEDHRIGSLIARLENANRSAPSPLR